MKVLLLILLLVVCLMSTNHTYADSRFRPVTVEEKQQILRDSIHILGGSRNVVNRWSDSINFTIIGEASQRISEMVVAVFNETYWLTNLEVEQKLNPFSNAAEFAKKISDTQNRYLFGCTSKLNTNCTNFIVVISDLATMHKIANAIPLRPVFQQATQPGNYIDCFFSPGISATGTIERSLVYVDESLELDMLNTCLHEEIFQSFGLFNDQTDSSYYSFNNLSRPKRITIFDKALLASLYNKRFRPGTSVVNIANHMIDSLLHGN